SCGAVTPASSSRAPSSYACTAPIHRLLRRGAARRQQSPVLEHRPDLRVLAVERAEHLAIALGMPAREDQVAEALAVGAREASVLDEPVEGVVAQHLRPQIRVVARLIAVGPDVQEIARAV